MKTEDMELIRQAQQGNTEAFHKLIERYDRKVLGLAYQMVGNSEDAEDIYQEVFMNVYKNICSFRFDSQFHTWLYRIVVNTAINFRKKRNRYLNHIQDMDQENEDDTPTWGGQDSAPLPDQIALNSELYDHIQECLDQLSIIQRTVFVLRFYQDFKIKDIADIISRSEGTVKNTLFRTTQKIQKLLKPYLQEAI